MMKRVSLITTLTIDTAAGVVSDRAWYFFTITAHAMFVPRKTEVAAPNPKSNGFLKKKEYAYMCINSTQIGISI